MRGHGFAACSLCQARHVREAVLFEGGHDHDVGVQLAGRPWIEPYTWGLVRHLHPSDRVQSPQPLPPVRRNRRWLPTFALSHSSG